MKGDIIRDRFFFTILPRIYRAYMGLVYLTSKKTYVGFEGVEEYIRGGGRAIAAIWHQDIILALYEYRDRGILTLASRSRDGEIIARALRYLGYDVVRGSSSRGGGRAMLEMVRRMSEGKNNLIAITVDGPRGPARRVKDGVIFLAMKTGARLYPVSCRAERNITLKSWDKTLIPLPFNRLTFRCGSPILTGEYQWEGLDMEKIRKSLEESLMAF